jgi:hypothetical protein
MQMLLSGLTPAIFISLGNPIPQVAASAKAALSSCSASHVNNA